MKDNCAYFLVQQVKILGENGGKFCIKETSYLLVICTHVTGTIHTKCVLVFSKCFPVGFLGNFIVQIQSESGYKFIYIICHVNAKDLDLLDICKWGYGPFFVALLTNKRRPLKGLS